MMDQLRPGSDRAAAPAATCRFVLPQGMPRLVSLLAFALALPPILVGCGSGMALFSTVTLSTVPYTIGLVPPRIFDFI